MKSFYESIILPAENRLVKSSTVKAESIYDPHLEKIEEFSKAGLSITRLSKYLNIGTPKLLSAYIKSKGIKKYK